MLCKYIYFLENMEKKLTVGGGGAREGRSGYIKHIFFFRLNMYLKVLLYYVMLHTKFCYKTWFFPFNESYVALIQNLTSSPVCPSNTN